MTKGYRNCLYRACSRLLCGKENLCYLLGDLTSIELFTNQNRNSAFSAAASDSALGQGNDPKNSSSRVKVADHEFIRNASPGTFSFLLSMLALSSVTGMNITSLYPENAAARNKYSQFLNGTIHSLQTHRFFQLVQQSKFFFSCCAYSPCEISSELLKCWWLFLYEIRAFFCMFYV